MHVPCYQEKKILYISLIIYVYLLIQNFFRLGYESYNGHGGETVACAYVAESTADCCSQEVKWLIG